MDERATHRRGHSSHRRGRTRASEKLAVWTGVAAIMFSVVIGGLTIHDKLIVRPRQDADEVWREFRRAVEDLNAIKEDIAQAEPAMRARLAMAARPQELVLYRAANSYLKELHSRDVVPASDLAILGEMAVSFGSLDDALELLKDAARRSDSAIGRVKTYRSIAVVYFKFLDHDGAESGRQYFRDALIDLSMQSSLEANLELASIYSNWAVAESSLGKCENSLAQLDNFTEAVDKIGQTAALELIAEMKNAVYVAARKHGDDVRKCKILLSKELASLEAEGYLPDKE